MAVQIGDRPGADFGDPLQLLSDCHRRIERFLNVLLQIADSRAGLQLDREHYAAMTVALEYFRDAAPKHTADEEESLFPRLGRRLKNQGPAMNEQIERLESEHKVAKGHHASVEHLGAKWLQDNHLPTEDVNTLQQHLVELKDLYTSHIQVEDAHVFPAAKEILADDELSEIGDEMARRRGLQGPHRASEDLLSVSISAFLDDLGSHTVSPSSGSVAALQGATSAMQARMAIECTLRKSNAPEITDRLTQAVEALDALRAEFEQQMSDDIVVCRKLITAYRSRQGVSLPETLFEATEVLAHTLDKAARLAEVIRDLEPLILPRLEPELQAAAVQCWCSIRSALLLAEANLKVAEKLGTTITRMGPIRQIARQAESRLQPLIRSSPAGPNTA